MKDRMKFFSLLTSVIPVISISFISCTNKNENLNNIIDKESDIIDKIDKNVESKRQFIQSILNSLYDSNQLKIREYIESLPKTNKEVEKSIDRLREEMKSSPNRKISLIKSWLSKNWLIFLNNMDKFEILFAKWIAPNEKEGKNEFNNTIKNYLAKVSKNKKYKNAEIKGNYIDSNRIAEWSEHTYKKINYYFSHDNIVFEFYIDLTKEEIVFNPNVWYFQNTKEKISLGTIDAVYHACWLHHSNDDFINGFEGQLVKKYGYPAAMLLTPREKN